MGKSFLLGRRDAAEGRVETFRFNRPFYPMEMFNSVLGIATRMQGPNHTSAYATSHDP